MLIPVWLCSQVSDIVIGFLQAIYAGTSCVLRLEEDSSGQGEKKAVDKQGSADSAVVRVVYLLLETSRKKGWPRE